MSFKGKRYSDIEQQKEGKVMKKYRVRKGSILEAMIAFSGLLALVVMTGICNHFVDGIF